MKKKHKSVFVCQECGALYYKWQGRCTECGAWNTIIEQKESKEETDNRFSWVDSEGVEPILLDHVEINNKDRLSSGIAELDRVLGGGIVAGSLILFGGEPGIGKSTLLLQVCLNLAKNKKVFYISGEESSSQIKLRAVRLNSAIGKVFIIIESNLEKILATIEKEKPDFVVIDSIQTLYSLNFESAPGSVSQIRNSATSFLKLAKTYNITFFIVGHITKEGTIAGPKVLEHIVDTVLYFEGDRYSSFRILRAVKNRFGAVGEIGIFEMTDKGLIDAKNISSIFIMDNTQKRTGVSISVSLEGTRAFLTEIQALVTPSNYGYAQRVATGIDSKRLAMLLAVLEKNFKLPFGASDVFLNIAGGLNIREPAIDFAIAMSILSSFFNKECENDDVFIGELGLSGEIRPVSQINLRLKEAFSMSFNRIFISKYSNIPDDVYKDKNIVFISNILEMRGKYFS